MALRALGKDELLELVWTHHSSSLNEMRGAGFIYWIFFDLRE
jgi:hypothetical protein